MGNADSITFRCENCGRKISAPKTRSGERLKCPLCKEAVVVPVQDKKIENKHSTDELTFLNISELEEIRKRQATEMDYLQEAHDQEKGQEPEETEFEEQRRLPWFIDIFLYPFSVSGLRHLALFIGLPLLVFIFGSIIPIQFSYFFNFVTFIVSITIFLYMYWYLAECIRDSADGWVRAPEGMGSLPDFTDLIMQAVNILGCLLFFLLPAGIYVFFVREINLVAWLLTIPALFFYPIGLLSVVLYDSVSGLRLGILIRSVYSTFRTYVGLVLLFVVMFYVVLVYSKTQVGILWKIVFRSFIIYFAFILAHLTGRYYLKNKDKLKWDL
jgi:hypothetical protein